MQNISQLKKRMAFIKQFRPIRREKLETILCIPIYFKYDKVQWEKIKGLKIDKKK